MCAAFSASSFTELSTCFGFRTLLSGGTCQIVLLILFTVISHKYGCNHPRDWMFSTSKLRAKKAAPTRSAFYLSSPERGAVSIQMANHQGFYTFTLSKNAEQRSAFSIMFWKRAGSAGFTVRADFPLARPSASLRERDRDKDHISDAW